MSKTILITGSTDGIGLAAAGLLAGKGCTVLMHGRNPTKLEHAAKTLSGGRRIETYPADLSRLADVVRLATTIAERHGGRDVLINNTGVFRTADRSTQDGLELRFAVNTIAPYLLAKRLLPLLGAKGRVVSLSSAAQAPVSLVALNGRQQIASAFQAYAQSKLALTMWSCELGESTGVRGPAFIAFNPARCRGPRWCREASASRAGMSAAAPAFFCRAALDDTFAQASGRYFDNDSDRFAPPHPDALDWDKRRRLVESIEAILVRVLAADAI